MLDALGFTDARTVSCFLTEGRISLCVARNSPDVFVGV